VEKAAMLTSKDTVFGEANPLINKKSLSPRYQPVTSVRELTNAP